MKKLINRTLCLLSICLCVALAACGGGNPSGSSTANSPASSDLEKDTEYKITFVQDGLDNIIKTVKQGDSLKDVPTPTAPRGYVASWDADNFDNIQGDMTVNAVYTLVEYKITYNLSGGINNEANKASYTVNDRIELYDPSREGYDFDGWFTDSNFTNQITEIPLNTAQDITLYAKWSFLLGKSLLVSFDSCGGTPIDSIEVGYLAHIMKPNDPVKDGYTFDGWYLNEEKWLFAAYTVSYDITLTAKWKANSNTLVFDGNGAEQDGVYTMSAKTDESIELMKNIFTRPGYEFLGWSSSAKGEVEYADNAPYTMGPMTEYTLYAIWSPNSAAVVFEPNGSLEKRHTITGLTDTTVTLPSAIFERAGYTLKGWSFYQDGDVNYELGAEYVIGTDRMQTLYAVWEANKSTLFLDPNGGEGEMENIVAETGQTITLDKCKFVKTGCTFAGWSTSADGEVMYEDLCEYVIGTEQAYTLYAVWEYEMYPINYVLGGGTNDSQNPSEYNMFNSYELYAPTLKGHTFVGWYLDSSLTHRVDKIYESTMGSLTLYAKWEKTIYTITYHKNGGECSDNENFIIDSLPIRFLEYPSKSGYMFEGWYLNEELEGDCVNSITEVGNYELYAKYVECTDGINLSQDSNGWIVSGYFGSEPSIIIPAYFKNEPVYKIADEAFKDKDFITDVALPSTVSVIGQKSFNGCTALKEIDLSQLKEIGGYSFQNCSSLESVSFGKELTKIGWYAFSGCTGLRDIYFNASEVYDAYFKSGTFSGAGTAAEGISLVIGKDVKSIPMEFMCTSRTSSENAPFVTSLTFEEGCVVEKIGDYAFIWLSIKELKLPSTVTLIGRHMFSSNKALETVELENGITEIGDYMFSGCSALKQITIPESVIRIREYGFNNCSGLEEIKLPSGLTTIGDRSFGSCTALKTIVIPESTKNIYSHAFNGCSALTICVKNSKENCSFSSDWNGGRPVIWNFAGDMGVTEGGLSWACVSETEAIITGYAGPVADLVIPSSVGEYTVVGIADYAFHKNPYVSGITIPNTVRTIGDYAFKFCYKLASVTIEEGGLEEIGEYAFSRCENLMEIVIPSGKIGKYAFYANYEMQSITICADVTYIGTHAFGYCNKLTIYMYPVTGGRVCETDWNSSYCKIEQITAE